MSRYEIVHCEDNMIVEETTSDGTSTYAVHEGPRGGQYFYDDEGDKHYLSNTAATHVYPPECQSHRDIIQDFLDELEEVRRNNPHAF